MSIEPDSGIPISCLCQSTIPTSDSRRLQLKTHSNNRIARETASSSSQARARHIRTPRNLFLHHLNASDCDRTAYYRTISRKALNDQSSTPYQRQRPIQFSLTCRLESPMEVRTILCATSSLKNLTFSLSRILLQYAATFDGQFWDLFELQQGG